MVTFDICTNDELIKETLTSDIMWKEITEDDYSADNYIKPEGVILSVMVNDKFNGLIILRPMNRHCYECHSCLLPAAAGKSKEIAEWLYVYLLRNTCCEKLVGIIAETNEAALRAAKEAGFVIEGYIAESFLRNDKLVGQYVLGVKL